jgi:hypothetical protein
MAKQLLLLLMVVVTLPLLSSNLPDKPDIYWRITKAPYLNKPQLENITYTLPTYQFDLEFNNPTPIYTEALFLQFLDIYTTNRAVNVKGYAIEGNPFLPDRPSLKTLIFIKSVGVYVYLCNPNIEMLARSNKVYRLIILNNLNVMAQAGDL